MNKVKIRDEICKLKFLKEKKIQKAQFLLIFFSIIIPISLSILIYEKIYSQNLFFIILFSLIFVSSSYFAYLLVNLELEEDSLILHKYDSLLNIKI